MTFGDLEEQRAKQQGLKLDEGKLRYDLLPPGAVESLVEVLTYGAEKYAPENWRLVLDWHARYYAAAMRHIQAYRKGERVDSESGLPHLSHAMACLIFLFELEVR